MQRSETLNYKLLNKWKVTFTMQVKKTIQHWLTLKAEEKEGKIHCASEENQSTSVRLKVAEQMEG